MIKNEMSRKSTTDFFFSADQVKQREKTGFWKRFQLGIYDPKSGEVLGKTGYAWGRLFLFYLVFYAVLFAMSMSLWWLFYQTIDLRIPTHQTNSSLIGSNPGLGFRPLPPGDHNILSSLIWYHGTNTSNFEYWTRSLKDFLEVYKKPGLTPGRGQNIHNCDYDRPPARGQVCDVDVKALGPCIEENNFMYHQSAPCILLKLNKIYGWKPEFYNSSKELPPDMPENLKQIFRQLETTKSSKLKTIWVSCKGESPADVENIGPIRYHPIQGFPGYFFPYENSEGYLSPLIAVQFVRPRTGILINVECRAWAKNIRYRQKDKQGSVHFELMLD